MSNRKKNAYEDCNGHMVYEGDSVVNRYDGRKGKVVTICHDGSSFIKTGKFIEDSNWWGWVKP